MTSRHARRAALPIAALFASACAVGPGYRRPETPAPARFQEPPPEGWKVAEPADAAPRGRWWEVFGDAGLNALEERLGAGNQDVAQAEAQLRAARAALRGARADFFPSVTGGASLSRGTSRSAAGGDGVANAWEVSGGASWEPDLFGRIRRNVEANGALAAAAEADAASVRLALESELAADWFLVHGVDQQIQLLDAAVGSYGTALSLTRSRHDQGVVSGIDVAQAETQLETTRVAATDLRIQRAQLAHAIAVLVGVPPSELAIPPAPIAMLPPEVPLLLPSSLLERRPDVAAAERRVAAANAEVGVATAGFFPRLLLSASGGWQSGSWTQLFTLPNRFWSLGGTLLQTLFEGGKRRAQRDQAAALYDADVAAYRQRVLTAFQQVEDDLAALRLLAEEAEQEEAAVGAAEKLLALANERYKGGITTYLEVTTAQTAALANARTAVQLLARRMTATVNLARDLGGGFTTGGGQLQEKR